jgi:hypothetical protein
MDATQFDTIARLFAARRSRRWVLAETGAGLASGAFAAAGLAVHTRDRAAAQDATPAGGSAKAATDPTFLFVQSFESGSFAPKAGSSDSFTLTLDKGLGQTVYFSDRPERIVGASPTAAFLKGMPFGHDNPPNAALVLEAGPDDTDVVVLELTAPTYDEATHTATYTAKVLSDYQKLGITFQEEPKGAAEVHPQFGAASLFIDDCPDADPLNCYYVEGNGYVGNLGNRGMCWNWGDFRCEPCGNGLAGTARECNADFPECGGNCFADY